MKHLINILKINNIQITTKQQFDQLQLQYRKLIKTLKPR